MTTTSQEGIMSNLGPYTAITLGLLVACAPADEGPGEADVAADREAIRAVIAQEAAGANGGDVDTFLGAFSADAMAIPPGAPAVQGEAMREWTRGFFEQVDIALASYSDDQIVVVGDYAIHHYGFTWTVSPKAGGEGVTESGRGIHILARQADGSWKITHDIWNTDAPMAGPAEM